MSHDTRHILDLPAKPNCEKELLDLIQYLCKYGAIVRLEFDWGEDDYGNEGIGLSGDSFISAGDYNCPHIKAYDPRDGHGVTEVALREEFWGENIYEQLYSMALEFKDKQDTLIGTKPITKGEKNDN
jgi:hypothetical protein